jgi:CRISPR-associated endoribonuclease Cas6
MPFLALVIALSAAAYQQNGRGDRILTEAPSLLFIQPDQEAKEEGLLFSLVKQPSWHPLLRITTHGSAGIATATRLLEHLLPGSALRIAGQHYHVQAVELANSDWAGISTWEDFLAPPVGRFFQFYFGTPLVLYMPPFAPGAPSFPIPTLLFGNLAQRWQALGGPALPTNGSCLADWLQDGGCPVTDYCLQGRPVALSPEYRPLGFLGHITYRCRGDAPAEQQTLTALARFAFFTGTGFFTDQGLGATRVTIDP